MPVIYFIHFLPILDRQGLCHLRKAAQPASYQIPFVSATQCWDYRHVLPSPALYMGHWMIDLRSTSLDSKCSYLLSDFSAPHPPRIRIVCQGERMLTAMPHPGCLDSEVADCQGQSFPNLWLLI